MARYVLRYTGAGPVPPGDVARVRACAEVVDTDGRTMLVEGPAQRVRAMVAALGDWVASPETVVALPPSRPRVRSARPRRASA